ncbi:Hypothetical predicted protein [Cloeon dipterum]|uniref:Uncharacterized protein n=1 Tax=Cloeon dipterum TaxID=197152 RepID=A0A8S1E857_9INSE|nr:Hypothetical predicted protein [Cloeon dipterum]
MKVVLQEYKELGASDADLENATKIIQTIADAREIGVPYHELKTKFRFVGGGVSVETHVQRLRSLGVLVRTGVAHAQLVLASFSSPWLIDSAQEADEAASVAVRPWLKVDGALNRKPLDRFLGGVLAFLVGSPGSTLAALSERFAPALQTFQLQELVEILVELGCVECTSIREQPFDLFSEQSVVETDASDGEEPLVALEPTVDAITRLTQFIGDQEYKTNSLRDFKIHTN